MEVRVDEEGEGGEEKVDEHFTQQPHPQKRQKRQRQQQHNPQSSQTSQTTLSEFEARELIKRARSILEGY